jgi:hypothetical protein
MHLRRRLARINLRVQQLTLETLFYGFNLERRVPDNHLLRKIDRFVDVSNLRVHLGCCPNVPACKIAHSVYEAARDKARS